jgi:DNA (cytosine-5)-methyltransferase 1
MSVRVVKPPVKRPKPIRILNLYAGLGGNRLNWRGHIEVTAVEINPKIAAVYRQYNPKDTLVIADAHEYLREQYDKFDMIWSSPPCQSHSRMVKATRHNVRKFPDMKLYEEIIFLQHFFKKGKWVVENVVPYYEPVVAPTAVLGRHAFWANFPIPQFEMANIPNFAHATKYALMDWLGIHYEGNIYYDNNHAAEQVLRNCVHPKMGEHVLNAALKAHKKRV